MRPPQLQVAAGRGSASDTTSPVTAATLLHPHTNDTVSRSTLSISSAKINPGIVPDRQALLSPTLWWALEISTVIPLNPISQTICSPSGTVPSHRSILPLARPRQTARFRSFTRNVASRSWSIENLLSPLSMLYGMPKLVKSHPQLMTPSQPARQHHLSTHEKQRTPAYPWTVEPR